jgi:hypothetical protein
VVHEVLSDKPSAHLREVDVPPDIESRDVHADAEDVMAGDDTIHEQVRIEVRGLLFLWSTRVEAGHSFATSAG